MMREVLRAMPKTEPCKVCGRNIPKSHKYYALFDAEISPISAKRAVKFWADIMTLKEKNGNLEYVR